MRIDLVLLALLALIPLTTACSSDTRADAAPPADTGALDGPALDALDAVVVDRGPMDTGALDVVAADAGAQDTGAPDTPAAMPAIHDCVSFEDRSAAGASRVIAFSGITYTPKCMQIAPGQTVTFNGVFSMHPLQPGRAPSRASDPMGSPGNPITATASGTTASFTFPAAGSFPFYCSVHEGVGMFGVILVR